LICALIFWWGYVLQHLAGESLALFVCLVYCVADMST
jgi:hypothetical protein